ncbi:MAG: LPS assembly protein LptD [Bryobacteraceae bacterium]
MPIRAPANNPNRLVHPIRANAPPDGTTVIMGTVQEVEGPWRRLRGATSIETITFLLTAEEIDYNEEAGYAEARRNVHYKNFDTGEDLYADKVEYHIDDETGKFYEVHGTSPVKIEARPGILTTSNPFSFKGKWAERKADRYILHDGILTNCSPENTWWVLKAPKFDIIPNDRALAYKSLFKVKGVPIFYAPVFYKSLKRMPRKSGFLTPNFGTSSRRGTMIGVGYYWAINRSYDLTYRNQYFTSRGFAHTFDFRGKPWRGADFNTYVYGVQDRGLPQADGSRLKSGGFLLTFTGRTVMPFGFEGRANINYLSSFKFRQEFTESFNEAIFSEVNSIGYVTKHWDTYGLNVVFQRSENFQSAADDDKIVIRKLPEIQFMSRDHQVFKDIPLWFSFGSAAGFLSRSQPLFQTRQFVERLDMEPRITSAFHWKDFNLIPSFSVRETFYGSSQRDQLVNGANLTRSSREFNLELIPPFLERVFDAPKWMGQKLKHVIEPRANFRYIGGIDNFQDVIRFDDTDIVANTTELEVSLTNRLYAKTRHGEVREVLSWQVAQRRFFNPDFGGAVVAGQRNVILSSVDLTAFTFLDGPRSYSPVVSTVRLSPVPVMGVEWKSDYDPLRARIMNNSITVDARFGKYIVSAGHTQVSCVPLPPTGGFRPGDENRCQSDQGLGSVLSPQANQFRWLAGYGNENRRGWNGGFFGVYDFRVHRMQFGNTQVSYNTDCCAYSVQYRRFSFGTRNENQFRFAFAVANIGSFGTLRRQERIF